MSPKIFITGVTGYIGGDIFYNLYNAHPDWSYTLLIRNPDRGIPVAAAYASAKLIYGDLSSAELISSAAAEADVVIHAAHADDVAAATAIVQGLAAGHTPSRPGYLLHVSGTGLLCHHDMQNKRYGQSPDADDYYDDLDGVQKILDLPETALHRACELVVQRANSASVRTAIVAPPSINGPGRGPVNQRSIQAYDMAKYTLQRGFAPIVGAGNAEWQDVHVQDLSNIFLSLAEIAVLEPEKASDPQIFGEKAYFFAENGALIWGEIARLIAQEAHRQGFLEEAKTQTVEFDEIVKEGPVNATWALNSKSKASRARKLLGWTPVKRGLKEEIPDIVASEAKGLGMTAKYAR